MSTQQTLRLSKDYAYEHIDMPYPCIEVHNPSDALALVLKDMPEGDLSIICYVNEAMREIRRVKRSALVVNALRKVTSVTFHKSLTESIEIKSGADAIEVFC